MTTPAATPTTVLDAALGLAGTATRAPKPAFRVIADRRITRRGVFWLGQTCNLRCQFCYFLDRIENDAHPEHHFMSLEKAKALCKTLVDYYGNNSVDIQGGEPTLYPHILDLVAYCTEIGLSPTLITNGQVLSDRAVAARYREARIRDFLVSVQALGPVYDQLVGRAGAHVAQMKGLRNLQEVGIPFRFNTVLSKVVLPQLADLAELAVRTGCEVVNFLGFNPFNDQTTGKRSAENVPTYSEVGEALDPVLDTLAAAGIEANVRYLPICVVAERHRPSVYDFPQIPYDAHENDFASWSWTDLPAQRMRDAPLTPPFGLGPRLQLGALRAPVRRLAARFPSVAAPLHAVKQRLERGWARDRRPRPVAKAWSLRALPTPRRSPAWADGESEETLDARYREDARMRAQEYTGYRHVAGCSQCDLRSICDGFYGDYADLFGAGEARPIKVGHAVEDPQHYTRQQAKRIHPLDREWLAGRGEYHTLLADDSGAEDGARETAPPRAE